MTNLWLFALAITKCAMLTGLGPGIAILLFARWRWRTADGDAVSGAHCVDAPEAGATAFNSVLEEAA